MLFLKSPTTRSNRLLYLLKPTLSTKVVVTKEHPIVETKKHAESQMTNKNGLSNQYTGPLS